MCAELKYFVGFLVICMCRVESQDCLNLVLVLWRFARRRFELELSSFAAGVRGYRVWLDG